MQESQLVFPNITENTSIYISQAPDIIYFSHDKRLYIPSIFFIIRKKSISSGACDTFLSHADVLQIIFFKHILAKNTCMLIY